MTKKATIKTIASGYASNTQLNFNFEAINDKLDNTVSLDGSTPNAMSGDLDLNSQNLLNGGNATFTEVTVGGTAIAAQATAAAVSAAAALSSESAALTSENAASVSAAAALVSENAAAVSATNATYLPTWEGPWLTATAYTINEIVSEAGNTYICLVSHTSGTFSTDLTAVKWELFAAKGAAGAGTGDMLAANNLSDVANVATSRSNLGLGDVAVQNKATIDITGGTVVGITDLVIADGGTGSSTASGALTNLGALPLAGGTLTGRTTHKTIRDTNYGFTGTVIDAANGDAQYKTLTANTTFTESLANGDSVELFIDDGAAYTVTWPTITWDDAAPTLKTTGYTRVILEQMNGVVYGSIVVGG